MRRLIWLNVLPYLEKSLILNSASCSSNKGTGKRGHIVADTTLLMMFLGRANVRDTK